MNILPISQDRTAGSLLSDSSRQKEVRELAQSVAAAQFGGTQLQQPQNGNSSQLDTVRLSDEVISELGRTGKPEDLQNTDQLISAMQEAFMAKADEGATSQREGAGETQDKQGEKGGEKRKVTRTTEWDPTAEDGEIHPDGREVIGKVKITEKTEPAEGGAQGASGAGTGEQGGSGSGSSPDPGGQGGGVQSSSPQTGNASANTAFQPTSQNGNASAPTGVQSKGDSGKTEDEDNRDTKENVSMTQNMKTQGMEAPGLTDGQQGANESESGGVKTKEFDVRTSATGATQSVKVRPAGELGEGPQELRTFKALDDSPILKYATLHGKGQDLETTARNYAEEARNAGERPEDIERNVERLRSSTPDQ